MDSRDLYDRLANASGAAPNFLTGARPIVLYGAGNLGRDVLRLLTARGYTVRCFLDQNARPGGSVGGVPVHAPDDPAFDEAARRETPIAVTIFNPDVAMPPLLEHLRRLGWEKVMPFVAFHRDFASEFGDRFWLTALDFYRDHAAGMRAAAALWSDTRSREIYDATLRSRLEADPAVLPAPDLAHQYFPADLPAWQTPCRFVDCGAFDGDTLEGLRRTGFALEAVAAFEPDADNMRKLAAQMALLASTSGGPETLLWPCAVSSATKRLRFDSGRGASSGLHADGSEVVQAVALDEALAGFRPTLIKMDIEGAEPDALLGARGIIGRHRPGLAICVYHRPQHLWEIPLLIDGWNLGYRFFLRVHRHNGFDVVLYALPTPAMIRLADYVFQTLADHGVRHVFLVTGGGAMHLNDALGRESRIAYVCHHHEQAAAMAAEGYARVTGQTGVVCVTTGPGGINALNGVFGAWTDSIPLLVISGQVKRETLMDTHNLLGRLRQLGDQEVDIVGMVRGITKYAVTVTDPETIRYHLEHALYLASHGRPGPCWLDVPVDVQATLIEPSALAGYDPAPDDPPPELDALADTCAAVLDRLAAAERPVILAGSGVRLSAGALELFTRIRGRLGVPVATAWTHDLIASDNPLFCGRPGSIGDRAGNFCVQNSDCLLVLGSRLNVRQVSYNWGFFARHAYKIQVDVDPAELDKPMVKPDLPITADAGAFLAALERGMDARDWPTVGLKQHADWRDWCLARRERYPVFLPEKHVSRDGAINPYDFARVLFEELNDDDVLVCGDATACIVFFQSANLRGTQRIFSNSGSASMGWDLPAAIGAAAARGGGRVICLAGDGSLQMNIQELQTLAHHRWPIKVFALNNGGYLSIRQTQNNFFGLAVGAGPASGVSFPDYVKVAAAYGLPAGRLDRADFRVDLRAILASDGPEICEVMLDGEQGFEPKLTSRRLSDGRMVSSPLEDMAPFLPREEFRENMIVPVME